jgi:hypothetical protein
MPSRPLPMTRTIRTFPTPEHFWPIVEAWAADKGFSCKSKQGTTRLYQKGIGLLVAPMLLQVTERGGTVTLEAWVYSGWLVRLLSLFMMPKEIGVETGGFKGLIPRKIARAAINELLPKLGQPPLP